MSSKPRPDHGRLLSWSRLPFLVLFLFVLSPLCVAQTRWFKYDGNPILDVGPPGSWDDSRAWVSKVVVRGNLYQMWYEGFDGTIERIGYATSTDKVTWRKHPHPVLGSGPPGSFDSWGVFQPDVLLYRSKYHMWYVTNTYYPRVTIGYASSPDGITWKRNPHPVLTAAAPGSWEGTGVCKPSVIPWESGFRMWYTGWSTGDLTDLKIGYAIAQDETTWVRPLQAPVLLPGTEGRWDTQMLGHGRVLFDGERYHMWFSAGPYNAGGPIGHAVSGDGIHWQKTLPDPALRGGGPGSWDEGPNSVGGILFDGAFYHMWYACDNGRSVWRSGYAVSPAGLDVSAEASRVSSVAGKDSVRIVVRLPRPGRISFSAAIRTPSESPVDLIRLFDDGIHQDSLAGDGVFANIWHPEEDRAYFVDLQMKVWEGGKPKSFTMKEAADFSTISHVKIAGLEFVKDQTPNPGDTLLVRLLIHHQGNATTIPAITASMIAADPWVSHLSESSTSYGDLNPGSMVRTSGYHPLLVKSGCPPGTDVRFNVTISSMGVPFLRQTVSFQVQQPWWKNPLVSWIYALLAAAVIIGAIRYMEVIKLRKRITRLEQERALAQERGRISQDMRDEVGSSLTEIAILSELARRKPDEASIRLNEISERTAELIDNVGEIIWAMNPKNDTVDNLVGYIRRYSIKYLDIAGVPCEFSMPEEIPSRPVASRIRQNVFMMVKEGLYEIVNDAEATAVKIEVKLVESMIEFIIQYDEGGPSLDRKARSSPEFENVQRRLAAMSGKIDVEPTGERGMRFRMFIPFL